jgi:hypothetical protein
MQMTEKLRLQVVVAVVVTEAQVVVLAVLAAVL